MAGYRPYIYSDQQVIRWAKIYRYGELTLMDMEETFGISHSTLYWSFQHRLYHLDQNLYNEVQKTYAWHMANRNYNKEEDL